MFDLEELRTTSDNLNRPKVHEFEDRDHENPNTAGRYSMSGNRLFLRIMKSPLIPKYSKAGVLIYKKNKVVFFGIHANFFL